MMLGRIEPAPAGADLRTFECPKCEYVHKVLVDDPFQSAKTRWTNSDLNPPKEVAPNQCHNKPDHRSMLTTWTLKQRRP